MSARWKQKIKESKPGQILVMLALMIPVLIVFAGMAIDFGMIYVEQSALSRALDAAALEGMRNLYQGNSTAQSLAQTAYTLNMSSTSQFTNNSITPTFSFSVGTDSNGNKLVNVSGTVTVNPFFLAIFNQFNQVSVSGSAQATRAKLVMSLVLDNSASMTRNGGSTALPPAVDSFINYFDDTQDHVAEIHFGTVATTGVAMTQPFKSAIISNVGSISFQGGTFAEAALAAGQTQINTIAIPAGQNTVRVAVFFTDGWANMIEDTLTCKSGGGCSGSSGSHLTIYGGCAPPEAAVGWCHGANSFCAMPGSSDSTCSSNACSSCPPTTFPSQLSPPTMTQNNTNVSNEAKYRAEQVALSMQEENPGVEIYALGMGDKVDMTYLQEIANDPASPSYNPNLPQGAAILAQTSADLNNAFLLIASKILLRLTH
ncbi:MAG TPA: VWA domain-containing protein [Candidatus Binataceae bacterium]|nr:VWA domain-containing protein [Candidatus Binataceae bacterium]